MNSENRDLDWLAAQRPQRLTTDPAARERALLALVRHTTAGGAARGSGRRSLLHRRTAAVVLVAAAASVAPAIILSAGGSGATGQVSQGAAALQTPMHRHFATRSPLVRLADFVSGSGAPAGDATLVARTTNIGARHITVYDLYADNGEYFFSRTRGGLAGQVSAHHNLAGAVFAREIAAARLAASGSVRAAAQKMADAPNPRIVIAPHQSPDRAAIAAKEAAIGRAQGGGLYDNWVWENSQDALIAGSGRPQVRAGVLRILATLPGVKVEHDFLDGQPTLTLSAGSAELGPGSTERLTLNADTGVPVRFASGPGTPETVVDYRVARVTYPGLRSSGGSSD